MPDRQTVIGAEASLFSTLFLRGRFTVPWHQRYYDWGRADVRALLNDIHDAIEENRDCYFLGAIMLVEVESRRWEINDGQQRMVTLALICAVLCRMFSKAATGSQREGMALRMLFDLDATRALSIDEADQYPPRIVPPKNDEVRYRQIIRGHTIGTNGTLTAAWNEIETFFSPMDLPTAQRYFDFVFQRLEVACLWIPQRVDPNSVYETINCRGKKLDDLDLIRNFFYSHFNSVAESERRRSVHDDLERIRTLLPRVALASDYMRCHLQCVFGFLRRDHFYRDVRDRVRTRKDRRHSSSRRTTADYVFSLCNRVAAREPIELFRTATAATPDPDFITAFEIASGTTGSRRGISVFLRELRGYTITQPLVFALLMAYITEADGRKRRRIARIVNRNLRRLSSFVLRTAFVAPKFEPSHFETAFSNHAKSIMKKSNVSEDEFAEFLTECDRSEYGILDDSKFYESMIDTRMTGAKKIKQFLLGVNAYIQRDARLLNERLCTIEHILPTSSQHWSHWMAFRQVDGRDWVQRIGNLTLMGPTDNKPGAKYNGNFERKKESYADSGVALTRQLRNYDTWTPQSIIKRQREMVKHAVQVWAFD